MSDVNVLVVFYSRSGRTERLALAAGLGAIQARASLRLRRLADLATPAMIEASPTWKENLTRMNRDYVAPRPADPAWADVIVLATPAESSVEVEGYCDVLRSTGTTAGKVAAPIAAGMNETILRALYGAAACAGMIVAPIRPGSGDDVAAAREHGRVVVEMARALKRAAAGP
jgi:NAD(P)H dehydrogenase (quinone)